MVQTLMLKNRDKVINIIKKNQPLIVLISLSIVISSIAQISQSKSQDISIYAIIAAIYFFISLIGSILSEFNKGLIVITLFYFGLSFGFLSLILMILNLIINLISLTLAFHILVFSVLFFTYSAVTINGLSFFVSMKKERKNLSNQKYYSAFFFNIYQLIGLILYVLGYTTLLYFIVNTDIFYSFTAITILGASIVIIFSNFGIHLCLKYP